MSSEDAGDRVGARPLSAFHTADIIIACPEEEQSDNAAAAAGDASTSPTTTTTIGITPLTTTTVLSEEEEDEYDDDELQQQQPSVLLSATQDDVFGLLQDPHADPPIITQQDNDASSSEEEEYHSPLEDNVVVTPATNSSKPIMNASPYDYDVNWDMVGHLRKEEEEEQNVLNTSLADAAVASMIASTTAAATTPAVPVVAAMSAATSSIIEEPVSLPQQQPFTFRRVSSSSSGKRRAKNLYRYQKYSDQEQQQEEEDVEIRQESVDVMDTITTENESTAEQASTSSSSAGGGGATSSSMTHRAVAATATRRRPRHARASSFHAAPPTQPRPRPVMEETTTTANSSSSSSRTRSSLDSGMAAVRRWIRSRASAGGSSRAARRWQRESSTLQLGEEDLFALTHAGEDPRLRRDFPSILEEEDDAGVGGGVRQRALSEPNNDYMRNFFFQRAAHGPPSSSSYRRARRESSSQSLDDEASTRSGSNLSTSISVPTHLSSAALNSSLFHSPQRGSGGGVSENMQEVVARTVINDGDVSSLAETSVVPPSTTTPASPVADHDDDPNREARTRWIRINRRFQLIITVVALIFSLLLFAILICWVVFTSAYVVSIDKSCDVPLKQYFWLATLQLILDVFRTDIMRFVFRWDTHSNDRIPVRVIMYNIAYLIYALLVLRLGVKSVFMADDSTCPSTAPELYQSGAVFVSLSIAAWSTIVLGYLVPFCFVATLLTWNGYTPTAENAEQNAHPAFAGGVFPAAYSTTGAPPGCVDQLRTVLLEEFPDGYPQECCICMGDFVTGEVIVATECQHVFHKRCCEEWLRQARTCPVCRMDIPSSLANSSETEPEQQPPPPASRLTRPFPGREDFHQDVVGLLQILRRQETRLRQRNASSDAADPTGEGLSSSHEGSPQAVRSESLSLHGGETEMVALEEGRVNRQHSN